MEVSGQLQAPAALPPGKELLLDMRLDGPQSRTGHCGEHVNNLSRPKIEPSPSSP
jgi:hypothetical protein